MIVTIAWFVIWGGLAFIALLTFAGLITQKQNEKDMQRAADAAFNKPD